MHPGKQAIAIHILLNISRRKDHQAMKFGQLMNIAWEQFFLKNHIQNIEEKLFPDLFLKRQYWSYLWINNLGSAASFYCMSSWGIHRYALKLSCRPPAFTSYKAFSRNKKRSGTSIIASFSAWFSKKSNFVIILCYNRFLL